MIARKISSADLYSALNTTNKVFADNIRFRYDPVPVNGSGTAFRFVLGIVCSQAPGHRRGIPHPWDHYTPKRLAYACWHVHGVFFDSLLQIAHGAIIVAGSSLANPKTPQRITREGGNWTDWQIGSQAFPLMHSEACDCAEDDVLMDAILVIRQSAHKAGIIHERITS